MISRSLVGNQKSLFFDLVQKTQNNPSLHRPSPSIQESNQRYQQNIEYHDRLEKDMSNFLSHTQQITNHFSLTFERYSMLSSVIQKQSLFTDSSHEINRLTTDLKSDIEHIKQSISSLDQLIASSSRQANAGGSVLGFLGASQSSSQNDQSSQIKRFIANSLKNRLMILTKDFQDLLKAHSRAIQADSSRKNRYEDDDKSTNPQLFVPQFTARRPHAFVPPITTPSATSSTSSSSLQQQNTIQSDILGLTGSTTTTTTPTASTQPYQQQLQQQQKIQQYPNPSKTAAPQPYQPYSSNPSSSASALAPDAHIRQRQPSTRRAYDPTFDHDRRYDGYSNLHDPHESNNFPNFAALVDQTLIRKPPEESTLQNQNNQYYQARAKDVSAIHSTIEDVANMYGQLNEMVHQQEETALRIDANINEMSLHIEAGQEEIFDYYKNTSNNQWLLIKIFIVIVVFALFFITVIS